MAQLTVVLDVTIVNIALPSAQHDLGFSDASRQWVVTAYALPFGSLLLLGGRIADLFGRKTTLLLGLAGFAIASAVGGAAVDFSMLVAARATQGVFGALLAPAALSLLSTTFTEPRDRARAFGVFGAAGGAGGAVGLLLGGAITEYLNWRWCLYVNLVLAGVAIAGASTLLRAHSTDERPVLDLPGTLTVSLGLFSLVYGFSQAETHPWAAPGTWAFLAAGVILLAVFVLWQTRITHPLLPMRVILDRDRAGAYLAVFFIGAGVFGIFLFLTYYLQVNRGYSPMLTGLAFLPIAAAIALTATLATSLLLPRVGPRPLISVGLLVAAGGMFWLTALDADSTYPADILPALLVAGLGLGLTLAPAMSTATAGVEPSDAGVASAVLNTVQQIGGSIGIAVLSTVATRAAIGYLRGKTLTSSTVTAAAIHSYTVAFTWTAAIFVVGGVLCGVLMRPLRPAKIDGSVGAPSASTSRGGRS
jgi:EmrB/QacA subfamily drug resistance transporter